MDYSFVLNAELLVFKIYNDHKSHTMASHSSLLCDDVSFPSYPGLDFVACIGGYGDGFPGLLVQSNKWIYNTSNNEQTYQGIVWLLLYQKAIS